MNVFIGHGGQDDEPFLQKFGSKPVIRTSMGEIHDQLEWFVTKWFQSQNDVVNQEISVGLTNFVPKKTKIRKSPKKIEENLKF